MSAVDWRLPVLGEPELPWSYLVLEAARGGVRVPRWLLLAVPAVVAERLRKDPDAVEGGDVEALLAELPADPDPWLRQCLGAFGMDLPAPDAPLVLADDAVRGTFRRAVPLDVLSRDATIVLRASYGRAGFFACMDAVEEEGWDARAAVAAGLYLVLLRYR